MSDSIPAADFPDADFSAKVRWRMAHDRNPMHTIVQDKVALRRYAKERNVAMPALLYVTDEPESLPFGELPYTCFIKANHGCGWNFLYEAGELYFFEKGRGVYGEDGRLLGGAAGERLRITRAQFIDFCRRVLVTRYASHEWAYQDIAPRIFVEERIKAPESGDLLDYRIYTFNGVARMISVLSPMLRTQHRNAFFTRDWQLIPLTVYKEQLPDQLPTRPPHFEAMLAAAERLGAGFDFMRFDFFAPESGALLGEAAVYPGGGKVDTPSACPRLNRWLGDFWFQPAFLNSVR